jgi:dsRNA-specific ribonuclease
MGVRAILTAENAPSYLQHFCGRLRSDAFSDKVPIYRYTENGSRMIHASVALPAALHHSLREHSGVSQWTSEKAARRDAAYHAYVHLYEAGLIDDHLLPKPKLSADMEVETLNLPPHVHIPPLHDVWRAQAQSRLSAQPSQEQVLSLVIERPHQAAIHAHMLLPIELTRAIPDCRLHWRKDEIWRAQYLVNPAKMTVDGEFATQVQHSTHILCYASSRQLTTHTRADALVLITPFMEPAELMAWIELNSGNIPAVDARPQDQSSRIARDENHYGRPFLILDWKLDGTLAVSPLSRRRNFLSCPVVDNMPQTHVSNKMQEVKLISIDGLVVEKLHPDYVHLSMLIPSLCHHLENSLLVQHLCEHLLAPVNLQDTELLMEALCAPSASEPRNYQRLEIIGDSVLKFLVSLQLFLIHTTWHEGYLAMVRGSCICNRKLASVAQNLGLGAYLITSPFSARRWKPWYTNDLAKKPDRPERNDSTKLLADVVEALIGAAILEGGIICAANCTSVFLPQFDAALFKEPLSLPNYYYEELAMASTQRDVLNRLQALIMYEFNFPRLLQEAITHPSCMNLASGSSTNAWNLSETPCSICSLYKHWCRTRTH